MWPGNQMKTGTCPCCKVCKNCPGFQKLLDRPDSGFILYRHVTHVEDIDKKTGVIEATTDTVEDVFIIENTQGAALKEIDFTPEIDRNQISCPRCVKLLEQAQSLFINQEIGDSGVIGVCEHCRQKSQREKSCLKCNEIVEKFQLSKSEEKQTHAQRVKTWLSKIQQLIALAITDKKGKKTESAIRRGHSDLDISKLFRRVSKSDHEPEIEDLFFQNLRGLQSAIKGPASERSYFPGAIREVAFKEPDETKPLYGTPQEGADFHPLLHSQSNATLTEDELEKDFIRKYGKSYKERRSFEDTTGRVRYVDEKYNKVIPSTGISYDDVPTDGNKYDVHGKQTESIQASNSRHADVRRRELVKDFDSSHEDIRRKARITDSDSHHEYTRRKEPAKESDSRHEDTRRKEPAKESDSRHEDTRRKEPAKESDSRHEGVRKKELVPTDSKHYASDKKKGYIPDSDSFHAGGKRKEQVLAASKYREDDKSKDFIPTPKTRHEEEKKKAGIRRDEEIPDEIRKRVTGDTKREDFISVIGKRFEEEIQAKGLTLAPKKSYVAKKGKDLTTASETRLEQEKQRISKDKDHVTGKKAKPDTKILFESPSRIKKYHSEESLIAGISKIKDEIKKHKTFDIYFPEKPEARKKKPKVGSVVSSSVLIKDTMDKIKTNEEKEKIKREQAEKKKAEKDKKLEEEKLEREKKKAEQDKKLEEEKLEREKLLADKLSAKLARDAEREKEKAIGKEIEPGKQITSKKDQEESIKYQDTSKKDRDALKRDKDVSKKDQDVSKKKHDDEMKKDKIVKEKTVLEKVKKDADKKGKEGEVDITSMKVDKGKETKLKDEDQLKAAKIKGKEEKHSEETTKDKKDKGKEVNITEKKDTADKDKEIKAKEGTADKQTATKRDAEGEKLLKQIDEEAKERAKLQQELRQQKEEERRLKLAAEQKAKEAANQPVKKEKGTEKSKDDSKKKEEEKQQKKPADQGAKQEKELTLPKAFKLGKGMSKVKILDLIKASTKPKERKAIIEDPRIVKQHRGHRSIKNKDCDICKDSDLELDLQSLLRRKREEQEKKNAVKEAVIGETIYKFKTQIPEPQVKEEIKPTLFQKQFGVFGQEVEEPQLKSPPKPEVKPKVKSVDPDYGKGVVRYALSDRSFIEKGWTMLPTEKVVRKMNVYRMRPAHPEFDWFEHNKKKGMLEYDTGEKLAEFDDNGRGRWYYRNGKLALDYYDAEELNAQQRFVIYSSGEPDERGRTHPRTVMATFDYLGNGCVFDHAGKIRLKYNQTEGVVLDRSLGPVSHWKWHTLNDPPVLQQVMIDTQMAHKDPQILKLGGPAENKPRPDDEEMLAIEFDNFIKEKSAKLSQSFKPFQIKMKALKINEYFSLRVLDQATVYLLYRDGSTNMKLNIGMILDHKEIVDTDTAEVGEVSNNVERLPARTDSLAELQRNVANAQRIERSRSERERRIRRPEPCASVDRLTAAASRPLKLPLRTVDSTSTVGGTKLYCKCRKPTACNVYYDTSLI